MKIDFKASSTLRKTLPHMTGGTKESSVNETMQCTNNNNSQDIAASDRRHQIIIMLC